MTTLRYRPILVPAFLGTPRLVKRLHWNRHVCGDKGHPMTTAQRHWLKAEGEEPRPYDCRLRRHGHYGKLEVIQTPVGTKRETVWKAIIRARRRWLDSISMATSHVSSCLQEVQGSLESMAETTGKAVATFAVLLGASS